MNREIKFRCFFEDKWYYFHIGQTMTDFQRALYDQCCLLGLRFYQFTGLKDYEGREIYEGDVLERFTGYRFPVELAQFSLGSKAHASAYGYQHHFHDRIVANIVENPERSIATDVDSSGESDKKNKKL